MDMQSVVRENFIRFLVQKHIFCPLTGVVLDYRTCTVILDSDGDPAQVFAPSIGEKLREIPNSLAPGYTLMER